MSQMAYNGLGCGGTHNKIIFPQPLGIDTNQGKTPENLEEDNFLVKPHLTENVQLMLWCYR